MAKDQSKRGAKAGSTTHLRCGIVMPISKLDGYSAAHWREVKKILSNAIEGEGFAADLVSEANDVGVIQKRIVQRLYDDPLIVCDVSGKNPNVMFELGMRLAFDKPTIIVKDDKTSYSFDTSLIEHLTYPRNLRHGSILEFQTKLRQKILGTIKAAAKPNYSTFLKHFLTLPASRLVTTEDEVSEDELPDIRSPFKGPAKELIDDMSPNRFSVKKVNAVYELSEGDRIITNRLFSPPVAFRLLAKTSYYELRFGYIEKEMIFNWPGSGDFRIGEAPAVRVEDKGPFDKKHVSGAGTIPKSKWVRIDLIVTKDSFKVLVEGHQRFSGEADMSKFKDSFSVFTCGDNKVHVKSLLVGKPA